MSEKSEQFIEQLLGAISTIAKAEVQNNSAYDKTEICTIVDDSQHQQGIYQAQSKENIKYEVYSDSETQRFFKNDVVRVSIPNNDYSVKKYIIGKVKNQELKTTPYITAESEYNNMLMLNSSASFNLSSIRLTPNMLPQGQTIACTSGTLSTYYQLNKELAHLVGISFDVTTYNNLIYNTNSEYQLIIQLIDEYDYSYDYVISSKNMLGNCYDYIMPTTQYFIFDISNVLGTIKAYNTFIYSNELTGTQLDADCLSFSSIHIKFGSNYELLKNQTVHIFPPTSTDKVYTPPKNTNSSVSKTIQGTWINFSEKGQNINFSDGQVLPYSMENERKNCTMLASNSQTTILKHYDELLYYQELQEADKLLNITKKQSDKFPAMLENYPKDKQGLMNLSKYFKGQDETKQVIKFIDQIISILKIYRDLFSQASNIKIFIDQSINNTNSEYWIENIYTFEGLYNVINTALSEYNDLLERTTQNELVEQDYNQYYNILTNCQQKVINSIEHLFFELNGLSGILTATDKTQISNLLNEVQTIQNELNEIDCSYLNYEEIIYNNENNEPDFLDPRQNTEWIASNSNFYSSYIYIKDETAEGDKIGGVGWKLISINDLLPTSCVTRNTISYLRNIDSFSKYLPMRNTEQLTIYKFVIVFNHEIYSSDEIIYVNTKNIMGAQLQENAKGFYIEHGKDSKSVYNCYNTYGIITSPADAIKSRCLELHYDDGIHNDQVLMGTGLTAYWYIPQCSSMLEYDGTISPTTIRPKAGYICYAKKLNLIFNEDGSINYNDSNTFSYKIKNQYLSSFYNNTIICELVKNNEIVYTAFLELLFGTSGNNGSPYSLIVTPKNEYDYAWGTRNSITNTYIVSLYNEAGENIPILSRNLVVTPTYRPQGSFYSIYLEDLNDGTVQIIIQHPWNYDGASGGIQPERLCIELSNVEIVENEQTKFITLSTQYAIPWSRRTQTKQDKLEYYAEGNYIFIYDVNGKIVLNKKDYIPWKVFRNGVQITDNISYRLVNYAYQFHEAAEEPLFTFQDNCVIPTQLYLDNYEKANYTLIIYVNGQEVWHQPLIILQDKYGSVFLNEWNGELQIDNENNTIMSSMMGVGRKNADNTFTGMLMGEIENKASITPPTLTTLSTGIGLYGIDKGVFAYGFNSDGTAFLGKSSGGRIWFDGNNGFIASQNWFYKQNGEKRVNWWTYERDENNESTGKKILQSGDQGMAIDLQNGHIDAYNFKLSSAGIQLNSDPQEEEDYVYIGQGNSDKPYIQFTQKGDLNLKVNSFELTGHQSLGNENLLIDTAPKNTTSVDNHWDKNEAKVEIISEQDKTGYKFNIFKVTSANVNSERPNYGPTLTQNVALEVDEIYTLSGWVKGTVSNQIINCAPWYYYTGGSRQVKENAIKIVALDDNETDFPWQFFSVTFNFKSKADMITSGQRGIARFESQNDFYLWHPKLEKGGIATSWAMNSQDIYNVDISLTQNNVFNALTNNGQTKGIWLDGNDLFINASVLGTAILRSNNLIAEYGTEQSYDIKDLNGNNIYYLDGKIVSQNTPGAAQLQGSYKPIVSVTQGTCWDLNTGKLWAADFTLEAGSVQNDSLLYLSNTASSTGKRLIIGNENLFSVGTNGYLIANSGTIAGWIINSNSITTGSGNYFVGLYSSYPTDDNYRLVIGNNFAINRDGYIFANNSSFGKWNFNNELLSYIGTDPVSGVGGNTLLAFDWQYCSTGVYGDKCTWQSIILAGNDWQNSNSDLNIKNSISNIDKYDIMFDHLKPCRYKYNYGTSDRYHTGFIAQEVVLAMESAGLTTQDFAGVIHLQEPDEYGSEWMLRRDEFVALNTWQIQKLKQRIVELETQVSQLLDVIKEKKEINQNETYE